MKPDLIWERKIAALLDSIYATMISAGLHEVSFVDGYFQRRDLKWAYQSHVECRLLPGGEK